MFVTIIQKFKLNVYTASMFNLNINKIKNINKYLIDLTLKIIYYVVRYLTY